MNLSALSVLNVSSVLPMASVLNASGVLRCVRDVSVSSVVFPCLYGVLLAVGLLLNSLALWIFLHIRSSSTFLVYLKNLLAADLLMALTLPLKLLSDAGAGGWRLRAFHCRYSAVLFYVSMYISILLLGLISLDRYLKVGMHARTHSYKEGVVHIQRPCLVFFRLPSDPRHFPDTFIGSTCGGVASHSPIKNPRGCGHLINPLHTCGVVASH